MQLIPIKAIPNQAFNILLDGNTWDFVIRLTNGVMAVSLSKNGVALISNLRVVAGEFVIPAVYQEDGNFMFLTADNKLPDYTLFGVTQSLVYASSAELEAIRASLTPPLTSAMFNPIADLPLRFAPKGYVLA